MYERAEKLFRVLLRYVTDFLVWEENFDLPGELQPRYGPWTSRRHASLSRPLTLLSVCRARDSAYYCVLYNDEHHSYDHVIYTLQRSVHCDQVEAQTHTALIDKEVCPG